MARASLFLFTMILVLTVSTNHLGDLYLDWLESEMLLFARSKLRMASDAEYGILGSSLGGLISCYAGWTRPLWRKSGCACSIFPPALIVSCSTASCFGLLYLSFLAFQA